MLHVLADVLKPLSVLSKFFQKSEIDFSGVNPLLESYFAAVLVASSSRRFHLLQHLTLMVWSPVNVRVTLFVMVKSSAFLLVTSLCQVFSTFFKISLVFTYANIIMF